MEDGQKDESWLEKGRIKKGRNDSAKCRNYFKMQVSQFKIRSLASKQIVKNNNFVVYAIYYIDTKCLNS